MAFTTYDPDSHTLASLIAAIFAPPAGVTVQNITVHTGAPSGEASTISFYNGSITGLNIGAGLLLTSGDPTPAEANNSGSYGQDAGSDVDVADSDLQNTVNTAFPEGAPHDTRDVTWLQFQVNVTDPNVRGLRFEVVFGSDEYPEYSDSDFVDVAGVYVNGHNYALFNNNPGHPLSVLDDNAAYFRDNQSDAIAIEYDGVSVKLTVTAQLDQGLNTVKIAIADTGDSIYDSGIFISGMQAVDYAGFGLSEQVNVGAGTTNDTPFNQTYMGGSGANTLVFNPNGGQDVFDGGEGIDTAIFNMSLQLLLAGFAWNGSTMTLGSGANLATLVNVERVLIDNQYYAAIDMQLGDLSLNVYSMLYAGLQGHPSQALFSEWLARADELGGDLGALGDEIIDFYAPTADDATIATYLFYSIFNFAPTGEQLDSVMDMIGGGNTIGDVFALGSQLMYNELHATGVVGSYQLLDTSFFDL